MKKIYYMFIALTLTAYPIEVDIEDYSIYFFGFVKHSQPTSKTHEGNMEYIALSKSKSYDTFNTEIGFGTYMDSYNIRAYTLFTNFTSDTFSYGIFKPLLGGLLQYKGVEYTSNKRKLILTPTLKLRIGQNDSFFMDAMYVPKLGKLTNGFRSFEFGYKF